MAADEGEFVAWLVEQLAALGAVRARRMFGGWGLFLDGRMFALVADRQLYLKSDAGNRQRFIDADLPPFCYRKGGRDVVMSYRRAPDEALEDAALLCDWARDALAAALRSKR